MATIVGSRTPLFYKSTPGGMPVILDTTAFTGNIFYVDSAVGTDGAGYGTTPDSPFDSIDYAIGKCTASQGDVILVLPAHAETLTTLITCDVAGVSIVGLGEGTARPAITVNANIDGISITAANVTIENIRFVTPSAACTSDINIAAANARIARCRFEAGANLVDAITITAAGELPTFEDNEYIVSANGPDDWLLFEGVIDRPIIRNNYIVASDGTNPLDDGVLNWGGQAITNPIIVHNQFSDGGQATTINADAGALVSLVAGPNSYGAACTGIDNTGSTFAAFGAGSITAAVIANDAIDATAIAAGAIDAATFAAGAIDAAAIANDAIDATAIANGAIDAATFAAGAIDAAAIAAAAIDAATFATDCNTITTDGIVVTRTTAALPQTAAVAIFTVTGLCFVKRIVGYVTTIVGNVANATKLKSNPSGTGATTDLCATVDFDNAAVGAYFQITGTFANAMTKTTDIPAPAIEAVIGVIVPPGTIEVDCAGNDGGGGRVRWSVTYVPLESGASIAAA